MGKEGLSPNASVLVIIFPPKWSNMSS